jgi:hypothetical protein
MFPVLAGSSPAGLEGLIMLGITEALKIADQVTYLVNNIDHTIASGFPEAGSAAAYAYADTMIDIEPRCCQWVREYNALPEDTEYCPVPSGRDYPIEALKKGKIQAFFTEGLRGPEALVSFGDYYVFRTTDAVLVPERHLGWTPKEHVPYRVTMTRRIGHGRKQVWLCRPADPAMDERRREALCNMHGVDSVRYQAKIRLNTSAERLAAEFATSLNLPKTVLPVAPGSIEFVEHPKWSEWVGETETSDVRKRHGYPADSWVVSGTRPASWRGEEGVYALRAQYVRVARAEESEDGRRMDRWTEVQMDHSNKTLVSGTDVFAAYEAEDSNARNAFMERYNTYEGCRYRVTQEARRIVQSTEVPPAPTGSDLDWHKVLEDALYKVITSA